MYYQRLLSEAIMNGMQTNPVTAVIGPRQCGKSTLPDRGYPVASDLDVVSLSELLVQLPLLFE